MSILESTIQSFVNRKLGQAATPANTPPSAIAARSIPKALLAGAIGGAVATAAKTVAEKIYPPRTHGEPEPPAVLADKVAGHELAKTNKLVAVEGIHWAFGIAVGAVYGAISEYYPAATSRDGASFGMTLMALTHESALPALGLSPAPAAQTAREKTSEMVTHVIYGVVTEVVRREVRKHL